MRSQHGVTVPLYTRYALEVLELTLKSTESMREQLGVTVPLYTMQALKALQVTLKSTQSMTEQRGVTVRYAKQAYVVWRPQI